MSKFLLNIVVMLFVLFGAHAQAASDPESEFKVEVAVTGKKCAANDYKSCYNLALWHDRGAWHRKGSRSKGVKIERGQVSFIMFKFMINRLKIFDTIDCRPQLISGYPNQVVV